MRLLLRPLALTLALASAVATSLAQNAPNAPAQPEGASAFHPKPGWAPRRFAVAAAHPVAMVDIILPHHVHEVVLTYSLIVFWWSSPRPCPRCR